MEHAFPSHNERGEGDTFFMLAVLLVENTMVKEVEVQENKRVKKVICFGEWMDYYQLFHS